jgi:CheY-like chemotaxis protein
MNRSLRILLVEDDPDGRDILARLLRRSGHVVEVAADARTALEVVARMPIDVLLSDIGLPEVDGCELMTAVQRLRRTPGIALTGFVDSKEEARCRAAGFGQFLRKPADLKSILDALAAVDPVREP